MSLAALPESFGLALLSVPHLGTDGTTRLAYLNVQPSFCVFICFKLIIETFGGV